MATIALTPIMAVLLLGAKFIIVQNQEHKSLIVNSVSGFIGTTIALKLDTKVTSQLLKEFYQSTKNIIFRNNIRATQLKKNKNIQEKNSHQSTHQKSFIKIGHDIAMRISAGSITFLVTRFVLEG